MKITLNARDLINIGVFTVIYYLVMFVGGLIGVTVARKHFRPAGLP